MCHLVLLLPVFGLALFWIPPFPIAATLYAFILIISIWMYRLVIDAMARPVVAGVEGLIGEIGEVLSTSGGIMQLMVHGEVWQATSRLQFRKGQAVSVTGVENMALQVEDASVPDDCHDFACHQKSLLSLFGKRTSP